MGRQQLNINLPDDVAAYLDTVANKTDTVVKAVRQYMQTESGDLDPRVKRLELALEAVCRIIHQHGLTQGAELESLVALTGFLDRAKVVTEPKEMEGGLKVYTREHFLKDAATTKESMIVRSLQDYLNSHEQQNQAALKWLEGYLDTSQGQEAAALLALKKIIDDAKKT